MEINTVTSPILSFEQLPANLNDWNDVIAKAVNTPSLLFSSKGIDVLNFGEFSQGYLTIWGAKLNSEFMQQLAKIVVQAQMFPIISHSKTAQVVLALDSVSDSLKVKVSHLVKECKLDFALVDSLPELSRPGLVLMDMDSTAIQIECIDEIAKLAGVGEEVSKVTAQAMQGKLDFEQSLRARVKLLASADEAIIAPVADNLPLMPGLELLVSELKAHGWKVAIASGGFTYFANKLKDALGLDHIEANELEIISGKLTGQVKGKVVDAQVKADTLGKLSELYLIDRTQTVAVGDGANDLKMMAVAALGVAIHAKPIVQEQAQVSLNNCDLEGVWYLLSADKARNSAWS